LQLKINREVKLDEKFIIRPGWCLLKNTISVRAVHDEEYDGHHDELRLVVVVIVLGQWIQ